MVVEVDASTMGVAIVAPLQPQAPLHPLAQVRAPAQAPLERAVHASQEVVVQDAQTSAP